MSVSKTPTTAPLSGTEEPGRPRSEGLKARGQAVGYMGDGINDALLLHTADVGISVMSGVEAAKNAAEIILLKKGILRL
jgi:P-type E1-E2 ATPase